MTCLADFSLADVAHMSAAIRRLGVESSTMEEVAREIVRYLHDHLLDQEGEHGCTLVRFFKTHPFQDLEADLQSFALEILGDIPPPANLKCLTLLATAGARTAWNDRRCSREHQAIPLASREMVAQAPMIANLISQFGLEIQDVLSPAPGLVLDLEQKTFNVFHVPEAANSSLVPAQEFVASCGIRSVLGFGGLLPGGDLFCVILFSRVPITKETAQMFGPLALSTKLAILPFEAAVFEPSAADDLSLSSLRSRAAALEQLLNEHERTVLEQSEKLEQLLGDLRQSNHELSDFAHLVAHELKAPLRAVKLLAGWLTEDYKTKLDEEGRKQLHLLGRRVTRMHDLIEALLQYARAGRFPEEPGPVDLNRLVEEAVEMINPPPGIRVEVEGPLPTLQCQKSALQQIFLNLIGNAVKFMDKPDGKVRVICSQDETGFVCSIIDNGPGIPREHQQKIFQLFQTVSPREDLESTGVGLAIVDKIIQSSGGRVWVESEPGAGCRFSFHLTPAATETYGRLSREAGTMVVPQSS